MLKYWVSCTAILVLLFSCITASRIESPLQIIRFAACPGIIIAKSSSTLSWQVTGASTIMLSPDLAAQLGTQIKVQPPQTTIYSLKAMSSFGTVGADLTVTVEPNPSTNPINPPPSPTWFNVRTLSSGYIGLAWSRVVEADGYHLERTGFDGKFQPLMDVPTNTVSYIDFGQANQFYTYRIRSINSNGSSSSLEISTIAAPPPPEGPSTTISPSNASLVPGQKLTFHASTSQPSWTVLEGNRGGTIKTDGEYTAPDRESIFHVIGGVGISNVNVHCQ
jgi:hypothetical protein